MLDHSKDLLDASLYALPWLAFLAGLGGSLHCVGMCGGLVTACSPNKKSVWIYQLGRLAGYSLLGLFAGTLGHLISKSFQHHFFNLVPTLTIGTLFIIWGLSSYLERSIIKPPRFITKLYDSLWKVAMPGVSSSLKPFGVGFFSILLPCGLLYGLVISVAAFHDPLRALTAMFFFWLGTVPAMALAPEFINRVLSNFFKRSPKVIGLIFMILGVATILYRMYSFYSGANSGTQGPSCH